MLIFNIIESVAIILVCGYFYYYLLNIYQQEHYDYKKFTGCFYRIYIKKYYLFYFGLIFLLTYFDILIHTIIILIISIFMILKQSSFIIRLRFTKRMIRIILFCLLIHIVIYLLLNKHQLIQIGLAILMPCVIYIANILNTPIEYLVNKRFIKFAKTRLENNKALIKIAITGSYGKTTVKNILNHILNESYLTCATPKSYNTLLGVTKTINELLLNNTEIFICEMGAFRNNEIKEMVELVNPDISIITEVGPQHLSTFKSIENVLKAKMEIVENLTFDKTAILNGDNEYLKKVKIYNVNTIFYAGINQSNDFYVKDIAYRLPYTTFNIVHKDKIINISSPLFGRHNINNIVIAYAVIIALRKNNIYISDEIFEERIKSIPQIPHRLEYKVHNKIRIFDDSYSSNIMGLLSACEVLKQQKGKKVIITPGIVDAGNYLVSINKQISETILAVFDDIYLIKNQASKIIANNLSNNHCKFQMCSSFIEAFNKVKNKYNDEEINLLIANDLPDNFIER